MTDRRFKVAVLVKEKSRYESLVGKMPELNKVFDFRKVWGIESVRGIDWDFVLFDYRPKPHEDKHHVVYVETLIFFFEKNIKQFSISYLEEPTDMFRLLDKID